MVSARLADGNSTAQVSTWCPFRHNCSLTQWLLPLNKFLWAGSPQRSPTLQIQGSFRGAPVTHYLDPSTGVNVIVERNGTFLSAWKLRPSQLWTVLNRGTL